MAELALDDHQRHAFASHLDRVSVTQLVRREPAPYACLPRQSTELHAHGGR
jgi:hypothetical protein